MSLSARIVLRPSRLLAVLESSIAVGGLCVAAAALTACSPAWSGVIVSSVLVAIGVLGHRMRRSAATVVVVSNSLEVGLVAPDAGDAPWTIAPGTMVWPGFSVVVLASGGRRLRTLPVFDRDQRPDDRRALHRFLLWTLRGGSGRRGADA